MQINLIALLLFPHLENRDNITDSVARLPPTQEAGAGPQGANGAWVAEEMHQGRHDPSSAQGVGAGAGHQAVEGLAPSLTLRSWGIFKAAPGPAILSSHSGGGQGG